MGKPPLPPDGSPTLFQSFCKASNAVVGDDIFASANEAIDWVWEPYVAAGGICTAGGASTGGKTTLLFLLMAARAAAASVEVLGHAVAPAPKGQFVVIVEPEHSVQSAGRKLRHSFRLLGLDASVIRRIVIVPSGSLIVGDSKWLMLAKLIAAGSVSDVMLDTIASTTTHKANDEQEQAKLFTMIRRALDSAPKGISPPVCWIAAHTRKRGKDDDNDEVSLDAVAGSSQRAAQSTTIMLVHTNKTKDRPVSATCRFLKLKEEPEGGIPSESWAPITYSIKGDSLSVFGAKPKKPIADAITELLLAQPDGLSFTAIRNGVGRASEDVRRAFDGLVEEEKIIEATNSGPNSGPRKKGPGRQGPVFTLSKQFRKLAEKTAIRDPENGVLNSGPIRDPSKRVPNEGTNVVELSGFRKRDP